MFGSFTMNRLTTRLKLSQVFSILVTASTTLATQQPPTNIGIANSSPNYGSQETIWQVGKVIPNEYVVQLKPGCSMQTHEQWMTQQTTAHRLRKRGLLSEIKAIFNFNEEDNTTETIHSYTYRTNDDSMVSMLKTNPEVAYVEPNTVMGITELQSIQREQSNWGLDRINQRYLPLDGFYDFPSRAGHLTDVYILDSGVYPEHSQFGGRAANAFGVRLTVDGGVYDDNGHGSHVAGIVGGSDFGVAKAARIFAVKVMDAKGLGSVENVLQGMQWVEQAARQTNAQGRKCVINLSLGGQTSQIMNYVVEQAVYSWDCVVVAAAGNSDEDACSQSPASATSAIAVGNINENDQKHASSNWGPCVSIYAPGTKIRSVGIKNNYDTNVMSGTSMAAPFVAGTIALWRTEMPHLRAADFKQLLLQKATPNAVSGLQVNSFWSMFPWNWGRPTTQSSVLYTHYWN